MLFALEMEDTVGKGIRSKEIKDIKCSCFNILSLW